MRVVAVHRDAVVVTSRLWQTNAVALRAGGEALLVDSPYFPDELQLLPEVLAQAGFEVDALLATHADFDHLLGRAAYPQLALGVGQPTAERLRAEPGAAQRKLREADDEHYVTRPQPLSLGSWQVLPVPGKLELGDEELELHPADGHTADGTAIFAPFCGVICCGDYLSDVEIPGVHSLPAYRAALDRLEKLVERAETVIPGHGAPQDRDAALRILAEDRAYLDALARGDERVRLPAGRNTPAQRRLHLDNLRQLT